MIDSSKLQYFTMAAWLRGYAEGLVDPDAYQQKSVIPKLNQAADMLDYVFSSEVNKGE